MELSALHKRVIGLKVLTRSDSSPLPPDPPVSEFDSLQWSGLHLSFAAMTD
jgi:hypothetical protein